MAQSASLRKELGVRDLVLTQVLFIVGLTWIGVAGTLGPSAAWMTASSWFVGIATFLILSLMVVVATVGLSVGKWVHNAGGVIMLLIFAVLLALPIVSRLAGHLREFHPFRTSLPAISLYNLNILGKLGFGALGGFEYVAITAGETRSPARSITRSVWIAAPIIAIMFVLGTSTVEAFVPPDQIDLVGPLPQVLRVGFGPFGIASQLVTAAILLTLAMRLAQTSVAFTGVTRLPMVAGWDRLLPAWFTRLHATYRTPVNSIVIVGLLSLLIALLSLIGVGQAEAFQLLFNAGGMFYALTYVVMFSIPLFGLRDVSPRPPLWLRAVAMSGMAMTLLYLALSIFPIIAVASVASFALKILSVIVIANAVGVGIFFMAQRRRRRVTS
ncbi:MAG: APC family permease [Gemmatimonadaceae bacterium]|nr:APC family permease [Gemmatimonadaceae bacterium]